MNTNEQQLVFPCNYSLKVIGVTGDSFETTVIPIINKHIPNLTEGAISYNKSRGNKYTAITIKFYAISREQVDALYQELTSTPEVLMAL